MQLLQPHCFIKKISHSQSVHGLSICMNVPEGFTMNLEKISVDRVIEPQGEPESEKQAPYSTAVKKSWMVSFPIMEQKGHATSRIVSHF